MKNLLSTLLFLLTFSAIAFAQSPQFIKFQGVARDLNDQIIKDDGIIVTIDILQDDPFASEPILRDEGNPAINTNTGVFTVNIGENIVSGIQVSEINWKDHVYYIKVSVLFQGTVFDLGPPQQILSVPYALYGEDEDANPENEIQTLDFDSANRRLTIQPGGSSVVIPSDGGSEANNVDELQTISRSGTILTLSNNGGQVSIEDNDSSPTNEIQSIAQSGNTVILSNGGGQFTVDDGDSDDENEIQYLTFNTVTRRLTIGPTGDATVTIPSIGGGSSVWDEQNGFATYSGAGVVVGPINNVGGNPYDPFENSFAANGNMMAGMAFGHYGEISCLDDNNEFTKAIMGVSSVSGAGFFQAYGPDSDVGDNNFNVLIASTLGYNDRGFLGVFDENNSNKAGMLVDEDGFGNIYADVKNFRMDHPEEEDKEIWYASLEGPEAGAYDRGTAMLVNGEATISFKESFSLVVNPETLTIMTSPWSAESEGIAIIERTATGFKVKELRGGTGTYKFDWEAKGVRKGFENYQDVREKKQIHGNPRK